MSLSRYLQNISAYHKNIEVLKKTHLQIIKDLGLDDPKFEFSGNAQTAYVELIANTTELLKEIVKTRGEHFYSILYRADLSEKNVTEIVKDGLNGNENLAKLLVDRELMKVLTREFYKTVAK